MLQKFQDYLKYELNRAPLTIEAYRRDVLQFIEWLGYPADEINYGRIETNDVRSWLATRAKAGETSRTLRRKVISLRTFFKWLIKSGVIPSSPLQDLPLPKISKPLPDLIRTEELESVIAVLDKTKHETEDSSPLEALIIDLLYSLGIRRAELVALDDRDISFENAEIKVTGKRSTQRVVPVPLKLLEKIKEWQRYRDRELEMPENENPLLVIKGKRISPYQVYHIVKRSLADTSARKKSPHALRHSFASGMLNGGAEMDSVREFLGHTSLATTQIYTHITLKEIKKAYSSAHPRSRNKDK